MFGNLGFPELLIIMIVILLLFGAKRIPEIAGSMGKGIKEFKKNINDATRDEPSSLTRGGSGAGLRSTQADLEEERQAGPKRLS